MAINHHAITANHSAKANVVSGQGLSNQATTSATPNNGGLDFVALFTSFIAASDQSLFADNAIVETDSTDQTNGNDVAPGSSDALQSSGFPLFANNVPVSGLILPGSLSSIAIQSSDGDGLLNVSPTSFPPIDFSVDKQHWGGNSKGKSVTLAALSTDSGFYNGLDQSEITGANLGQPATAGSTLSAANFAVSELSQAGLQSTDLTNWLPPSNISSEVDTQVTEMLELVEPTTRLFAGAFPDPSLGVVRTPQSLPELASMSQLDAPALPAGVSNVIGDLLTSMLSDKKLLGKSNGSSRGGANGQEQFVVSASTGSMVKQGDVSISEEISKKAQLNADPAKVVSGLGGGNPMEGRLLFGDTTLSSADGPAERAADSLLRAVADQSTRGNQASAAEIVSASGITKPSGYDSSSMQLADTSTNRVFAKIDAWIGQSGWSDHLGGLLVNQINNQVQSAEIAINPPQLGPIVVQIDMGKDQQVNVHFAAVQSATREAIQAALPRLDQILSASSINLGQTSVGSEQRQGQSAESYFAARPDQGGAAAITSMSSAETTQLAKRLLKQDLGLVDFYA